MKHHPPETHEHIFEIHNIVLSSQSIYLEDRLEYVTYLTYSI